MPIAVPIAHPRPLLRRGRRRAHQRGRRRRQIQRQRRGVRRRGRGGEEVEPRRLVGVPVSFVPRGRRVELRGGRRGRGRRRRFCVSNRRRGQLFRTERRRLPTRSPRTRLGRTASYSIVLRLLLRTRRLLRLHGRVMHGPIEPGAPCIHPSAGSQKRNKRVVRRIERLCVARRQG